MYINPAGGQTPAAPLARETSPIHHGNSNGYITCWHSSRTAVEMESLVIFAKTSGFPGAALLVRQGQAGQLVRWLVVPVVGPQHRHGGFAN